MIHVCIHVYIRVCACVYVCAYVCLYVCVSEKGKWGARKTSEDVRRDTTKSKEELPGR